MFRGRIEILEQLGEGGLGVLHRCRDESGFEFAVKLAKSPSSTSASMLEDEERRLWRHRGPHVVAYLGRVKFANGAIGLAIELMEGDLTKLGRLTPSLSLKYFHNVIHALSNIHRSAPGAFHGDIKRANLLFKAGVAKLTDFGLARGGLGQTVMVGHHQGGTPGYMPPEGFASQRGDMYSLGAAVWATLSGRDPMPGELLTIEIPYHPRLEWAVNRMLDRDPETRLTVLELERCLPSLEAEAALSPPNGAAPLWSFFIVAAAIAGVIALAMVLIARLQNHNNRSLPRSGQS